MKDTVIKSNQLNEAFFSKYTMIEYKIFLLTLAKYNEMLDKNIPIEIRAKDCIDIFECDEKNIYKHLRKFKEIMVKPIYIKHLHNTITKEIMPISWIEYDIKFSFLSIKINPDLMPHIEHLKEKFTTINIKAINEFGSLYTIRMYELINQFKYTGYIRKTIEELARMLGYEKNMIYGNFKSSCLNHAIDEIFKIKRFNIKLTEIKVGRKVAYVELRFAKNKDKAVQECKDKIKQDMGHYNLSSI